MSKYPCGYLFKLPRFCEGRKCETCILRKDVQNESNIKKHKAVLAIPHSDR